MSKFKVGDVWKDGYGDKFTIVCTDGPGDQPVVAVAVSEEGKTQSAYTFYSNGQFFLAGVSAEDLSAKVHKLWEGKIIITPNGRVVSRGAEDWSSDREIRVREVRDDE